MLRRLSELTCLLGLLGTHLAASSEMRFESGSGCGKLCEYCNATTDSCSQCASGYAYNYNSKACEVADSSITNCKVFSSKSKCGTCAEGFTLSGGICEACISNCQTCDSNPAKCDLCKVGFGSPDSTSKTCTSSCGVANCQQCVDSSTTTCKTCKSGYRLTTGLACEQCKIANCSSCLADVSKCDFSLTANSCNEGYFYLNDTCVTCETGCRLCDNDGQCLACNTTAGYYMWQDMQCFRAFALALGFWLILTISAIHL